MRFVTAAAVAMLAAGTVAAAAESHKKTKKELNKI